MNCPNCRQQANKFKYRGIDYIECDSCGTFELTEEGEAIATELIIESQQLQQDSEAESTETGTDTSPSPSPADSQTDGDTGFAFKINFEDE